MYLTEKELKKFWKERRKARVWLNKFRKKEKDARKLELDRKFIIEG
jgi:hypothetical protein